MQPSQSNVLIHAIQLTRTYSLGSAHVVGLDGIDVAVNPGELVVLKGISGSGKSTLLSLLAGLDRPTRGNLHVAGYNLGQASEKELLRFRRNVVGMVFQAFNLLPTINVLENICLPGLLSGTDAAAVRYRAMELLQWLNLADRQTHLPSQLSGGEMQRTAIARALINNPTLILADEPTGNLDSRNGEKVVALLAELNRDQGRTVVIATHSDLADDVATLRIRLRDGKIANQA